MLFSECPIALAGVSSVGRNFACYDDDIMDVQLRRLDTPGYRPASVSDLDDWMVDM